MKNAEETAKLKIQNAETEIEMKVAESKKEIKDEIVDVAYAMASSIVGKEIEKGTYDLNVEDYLKGINGTILTVTDAKGVDIDAEGEGRVGPIAGDDLTISLDVNIQSYATQLAEQAMEAKDAESVSIIVMNPQNGEILAMVSVPEYDLNNPFGFIVLIFITIASFPNSCFANMIASFSVCASYFLIITKCSPSLPIVIQH